MRAILFLFAILPAIAFGADRYTTDLDCLTANIYHEARGEGTLGMVAVGQVTLNRVKDSRWKDTICGVVYQPYQFSWTNYNKRPRVKEKDAWKHSRIIAKMLLDERRYMFEEFKATHYVHKKLHGKFKWTKKPVYSKIGKHVFY